MGRSIDFDRYVAACDYPGVLDEAAVAASLQSYLHTLGVTRTVRRLPWDWDLATEEPLRRTIAAILDDTATRAGWPSDARDAFAARDARDARDAIDARDAFAARDARDARDAFAARDARDARDAIDARDALDARDARAARAGALRRFTSWCLHRSSWFWYGWDLSWIVTTLLGAQQRGSDIPWARPLFEAYVAGAWFLYWTDDTLYWVAKPTVHVERNDETGLRRLHCADGPALESDAENLYFIHGVMVPAFVVTRPDWITVQHIQQEENAEVRRIMLERYGFERFVTDSGATPVSSDAFGDLYRIDLAGDEPLALVFVNNRTPEPDGSTKQYALRVPPDLETAHAAVAWTFGMTAATYQPSVET
jgi:hypothetical protein